MNWEPDYSCSTCDLPVRWFGERPVPKALADRHPPVPYEVLYIARLDSDAPNGEPYNSSGYFPFVMVLRLNDNRIELRPRYFIVPDFERPDRRPRYGQDGPIYTPSEWTYLAQTIITFLTSVGVFM